MEDGEVPKLAVVRARAIWMEIVEGIGGSATALMARLDALTDPERAEDQHHVVTAFESKFRADRQTGQNIVRRSDVFESEHLVFAKVRGCRLLYASRSGLRFRHDPAGVKRIGPLDSGGQAFQFLLQGGEFSVSSMLLSLRIIINILRFDVNGEATICEFDRRMSRVGAALW